MSLLVSQLSCLHSKKAPAKLFALRWVYYRVPAKLFALKENTSPAVCAEVSLLGCLGQAICTGKKHQPGSLRWDEFTAVYQLLFALKGNKTPSIAVCAEKSLQQCTSQPVSIERNHQPSCLRYGEFTCVPQPSCLHCKKAPARLFVLRWFYCSVPAELFAVKRKKTTSWAVRAEMSYYSVPAELFELKEESTSQAVFCWDEPTKVHQPSCLHWKKAPAEPFALL